MMDNKIINGVVGAIWTHGHGCGCNNERTFAGKPMADRMKDMSDNLLKFGPQWNEEIMNVVVLMMAQIPPFIEDKKDGATWYRYLHVAGGIGTHPARPVSRVSGEFDILLYYAAPSEIAHKGETCDRLWCIQNNIEYGEGETIYHAYMNYLTKIKK